MTPEPHSNRGPRQVLALILLSAALGALPLPASAQASELSEASGLSMAVSVAVPMGLLVGGSVLTVAAVQASAEGTVVVFERASDGVRGSLRFSAQGAAKASLVVGTPVMVSAVATGLILHVAGRAVGFMPNQRGRRLTHHERMSP